MNKYRQTQGFTLLEMLVAVAIFAFLSLAAYQVLQGVLQSDQASERHSQRMRDLQRSMNFLQRDLSQVQARTVRDENQQQSELIRAGRFMFESDDDGIELVSLSWRNPDFQLPRSQLQRIRYILKDQQLLKQYYPYPDAVVGQELRSIPLLDQVESFQLRFYTENKWQQKLPSSTQLPEAIELRLVLSDYGELRRVFVIAQGQQAEYTEDEQPEEPDDES